MNTELRNAIIASDTEAQYDECVKRLLGNKDILAHILVKTVDEFKGMRPADVVQFIVGEPYLGNVPAEPGLTNAVIGAKRIIDFNTESSERNEGLARFDIVFRVRTKAGLSQIIVNVEAQRSEPDSYEILNRAIFYVSRLTSSQKERDFVNSNYDDIKQVYSIWVCMNMKDNTLSHIHFTKDNIIGAYDWGGNLDLANIVMIGLSNRLPAHDDTYELHRLLGALLSNELAAQDKLTIVNQEYSIPVIENIEKEVNIMCNLSQDIKEKGIAEGREKGIAEGREKGIAEGREKGIAEGIAEGIKNLIFDMKNNGLTPEQIAAYTGRDLAVIQSILGESVSDLDSSNIFSVN